MQILYENYYQLPKNIFKMRRNKKISLTAFDIIILFIDRNKISKLIDEDNNRYFIYTVDELMKELNITKRNVIVNGINELVKLKIINKKRGYNKPTRYYIL